MTRQWKNKRILVLSPDLPYPCIGGGRTRMASILDALGSLAPVVVAARATTIPEETAAWCAGHGCSIRAIDLAGSSFKGRVTRRLRQMVTGDDQAWDRRERRLLGQAFNEFKPDLVWVEASYQVRYALEWRDRACIVVDFWGTSEGADRVLSRTKGWARLWHWYHYRRARQNEARQVPLLSAAVVVSDHLGAYLRMVAPTAHIISVPTALTHRTDRVPLPRERNTDMIVLSGVMSFGPNVDAAVWFVNYILPLIRRKKSKVWVILAGAAPSPEILALTVPGQVEVPGAVDDLQGLIAASAVYALPMRLGSGIRTKLLDAFPSGTPIVTTAVGAEGFDLRDGENALFANDAESFAEACVRLLDDSVLAARIGNEARRLADEVYTQEKVRRIVVEVLERCLGPAQERAV